MLKSHENCLWTPQAYGHHELSHRSHFMLKSHENWLKDTTKNILNCIKNAENYTSLDTKSAENIILYINTIGKNTATLKNIYI